MKQPAGKAKGTAKALYHGVPGTSSHKACTQFFGTETPLESCTSFRQIFEQVVEQDAALGLIPVENSLAGSIHENYDLAPGIRREDCRRSGCFASCTT